MLVHSYRLETCGLMFLLKMVLILVEQVTMLTPYLSQVTKQTFTELVRQQDMHSRQEV